MGEITWQSILIFRCSRRVFCAARTFYGGKSPARSLEMKFFRKRDADSFPTRLIDSENYYIKMYLRSHKKIRAFFRKRY